MPRISELYDLMLVAQFWKQNSADTKLYAISLTRAFIRQVEMDKGMQKSGIMPDTLKIHCALLKVHVGTLHGIARLLIDGIYVDRSQSMKMCECAVIYLTRNDDRRIKNLPLFFIQFNIAAQATIR